IFKKELQSLHTYLGLRETAKHYLMKGYALIRRILVELDQRYRLDGGIFFLLPEEVPQLVAGENLSHLIAQRRRRRDLLLSLEVPQVLFSDDLEAIGRQQEPTSISISPQFKEDGIDAPTTESAEVLHGVPLSAGVAEGSALVLTDPT